MADEKFITIIQDKPVMTDKDAIKILSSMNDEIPYFSLTMKEKEALDRAIYALKDKIKDMPMTYAEAAYCMQSYLPDEDVTHCTECPYYGCKELGDGSENGRTCRSSEAHRMAMQALKFMEKQASVINDD